MRHEKIMGEPDQVFYARIMYSIAAASKKDESRS